MQTAWKVSISTMIAALAFGGIAVLTVKANAPARTAPAPRKQYEWRTEPAQPEVSTDSQPAADGTMPRDGSWEQPKPEPKVKKPGDVTPEQHQAMLDLLKPKPEPYLPPPSKPWYNCPSCYRHGRTSELTTRNDGLYCPECKTRLFAPRRRPVVTGR